MLKEINRTFLRQILNKWIYIPHSWMSKIQYYENIQSLQINLHTWYNLNKILMKVFLKLGKILVELSWKKSWARLIKLFMREQYIDNSPTKH